MAPLDSKNLALLLQVKTAKIGVLGALNGHLALAGSNRDHFLQAGFLVVIRPACQNSVWPASCLPTIHLESICAPPKPCLDRRMVHQSEAEYVVWISLLAVTFGRANVVYDIHRLVRGALYVPNPKIKLA